jgi:hypothetical protein
MPVVLDVRLGGFRRVMRGVVKMALRRMSVMGCRFVVSGLVMPGRLAMMLCCAIVVLRCLGVMLCRLLGHVSSRVKNELTRGGYSSMMKAA